MNVARKCSDAGVTLALEAVSEELATLLRMTNMDQVFRIRGARVSPARAE